MAYMFHADVHEGKFYAKVIIDIDYDLYSFDFISFRCVFAIQISYTRTFPAFSKHFFIVILALSLSAHAFQLTNYLYVLPNFMTLGRKTDFL